MSRIDAVIRGIDSNIAAVKLYVSCLHSFGGVYIEAAAVYLKIGGSVDAIVCSIKVEGSAQDVHITDGVVIIIFCFDAVIG